MSDNCGPSIPLLIVYLALSPTAGVPIVKFEVKIGDQRIQADINTNERLGVLNSRLINAYCELHPFIRPLCVLVKVRKTWRKFLNPRLTLVLILHSFTASSAILTIHQARKVL